MDQDTIEEDVENEDNDKTIALHKGKKLSSMEQDASRMEMLNKKFNLNWKPLTS